MKSMSWFCTARLLVMVLRNVQHLIALVFSHLISKFILCETRWHAGISQQFTIFQNLATQSQLFIAIIHL